MASIARCAAPMRVVPSCQQNICPRKSFAPVPVAPRKYDNVRSMVTRSRQTVIASAMSTAKIVVQGRQLQVTPAIREYAENKVNKAIAAFEGSLKEVDVKLSASGSHGKGSEAHHQRNQKVEVTVFTVRHGVVRVEDTEDDLYAAIDLVTDKLRRKMVRLKEKAVDRKTWPGRGGPKGADVIEAHIDPESSDEELPTGVVASGLAPEIVREKLLLLSQTMSPEDAMDQVEQLDHDFFVFVDSNDGALKVLYRRKVNGYGLLIPQVQL